MTHQNKKFKIQNTAMLLIIALIISSPAFATEVSGVTFETRIMDEGLDMQLKGTSLKRVVFFKAFVAAFYEGFDNKNALLGESPKRIEVEYFVKIPATKMQNFTVDSMKDNITEEEFGALANEIESMGRYFVNLKPGDRYSLTYIPGLGTKFVHNGELSGIIEGKDFQKALFSVWIGEKPFDQEIKKEILGSKNDKNNNQDQLAMKSGGMTNDKL